MKKLWQGDIVRYMVECLRIPQIEISRGIAELGKGISDDPTKISKLLSGKAKTGYEDLQPCDFYNKLIKPELERKGLDPSRTLPDLKEFLEEQGIDFPPPDGLTGDDAYEGYMLAVLEEGLPRVKRPRSAPNTQQQKHMRSEQVPAAEPLRPTLHPQNFTSISGFTGRQDVLTRMDELLQTERTVVLSGIGGIGKTSLTNEYARQNAHKYTTRQRIVCGNTIRSFRQMILAIDFDGLDETGVEEDAKFQERMKSLKRMDDSVLLLLDNIDERPEDYEVFRELRSNSKIHIIITTRLHNFEETYTIPVDVLKGPEQLKLFEHHLRRNIEEKDLDIVTEILKCVDGHTLLIELIAKSIDCGSLDYSEMLQHLREGAELAEVDIHIKKDDYDRTGKMWNFVQTILFNIEPLPEEQRAMLRNLVLLPTEGISRRLFRKLSPQIISTLTQLENKSWSIRDRQGDVIRLHPVIRETVKKELPPTYDDCRAFLDRLKQMMEEDDSLSFSEDLCKLIQSTVHTLDFAEYPSAGGMNFLNTAVKFYRRRKEYDYRGALEIYRPALQLLRDHGLFPGSETTAEELYTNAGSCHKQLAEYKDAIRLYEEAANAAPAGSCQLAHAYRNLGEVYRKDSQYDKALEFDQLALELFTEDYDIAEARNAIGVVYINKGKYEEGDEEKRKCYYEKAKESYLKARELWEACLGRAPSDELYKQLAYANHNIGTACRELRQFADAAEQHEKALHIREEHKFPEQRRDIAASHVWIGNDYLDLAKECKERGETQEAEVYMQKSKGHIDESRVIRKELLGEYHPDYAWSLNALSCWYETRGDIENALKFMEEIIGIRRAVLSDDHQYTKDAIKRRDSLMKLRKKR